MLRLTIYTTTLLLIIFVGLSTFARGFGNPQPPMLSVLYGASDNDVVLWDMVQGHTLQMTFSENYEARPTWSNDGEYIAYLRWDRGINRDSRTNFVPNLYIVRADGSDMRLLINVAARWQSESSFLRGAIRWSPDSSRLMFYYRIGGLVHLHIITPDGNEIMHRVLRIPDDNMFLWSGNGTHIYRFGRSDGGLTAYRLQLTQDAEFDFIATWEDTRSSLANAYPSPAGRYVVLYDPHNARIDLFDLDSPRHAPVITGASLARIAPHWSPDGTAIAYYKPLTNAVIVFDMRGYLVANLRNPVHDDEISQIMLSDAPYTAIVEMVNNRCVLREQSTQCLSLVGIRTLYNSIRPTQH